MNIKPYDVIVIIIELPDDRTFTQRNSSSRVRGKASRPVHHTHIMARMNSITLQCIPFLYGNELNTESHRLMDAMISRKPTL